MFYVLFLYYIYFVNFVIVIRTYLCSYAALCCLFLIELLMEKHPAPLKMPQKVLTVSQIKRPNRDPLTGESLVTLYTSSQLLVSLLRRWVALFGNMARMVSTSIADVECKHSQSQHWSDRPFATMVAKHINSEFKVHKQDARREVIGHLQETELSAGGGQQPQQIGHVTVTLRQKQSRAKSPYMFFRDDWIKTQKQCSAGRVNPATKEFWDDLKRNFAALNPEHRAYYEHLSEQSAMLSKQKRDSVAKSSLPSPNSGCNEQIAKRAPDQALAMNLWVAHPNNLDKHVSWDGISQEIMDSSSTISSSPKLLGDDVHDCSPISEEMLERAWKRNLSDGVTWADNLARFDKEAQQFAEPPRDAPGFPKRVFYQGCCGSFCRRHNPPDQVQFFTRLTTAFSSLVKQLGPVGVVAKKDILLKCELTYDNGYQTNICAWLVAPAAASGIHSAQQSFILTEVVDYLFETHFKLKLTTLPPTQSKRTFSASAEPIGPLHQLTGDQFAEYLLNLQDGHVPEISLQTARIRRLRFEDVSLSTVQVVGYDNAFVPIVLAMGDGEDSTQEALPDQHISETPSVLEDHSSDLVDDGDLLAMVCKNDAGADRKTKNPEHMYGEANLWRKSRHPSCQMCHVINILPSMCWKMKWQGLTCNQRLPKLSGMIPWQLLLMKKQCSVFSIQSRNVKRSTLRTWMPRVPSIWILNPSMI